MVRIINFCFNYIFLIFFFFIRVITAGVASVQLRAYVSQHGLHGEFHFVQRDDNSVEIKSYLETTLQYPDQIWSWGIHKMPVDYREIDGYRRCHLSKIGSKVIDFDSHLGYLEMPGNESVEWTLSSEIISKLTCVIFFIHFNNLKLIYIYYLQEVKVFGANHLSYKIQMMIFVYVAQ